MKTVSIKDIDLESELSAYSNVFQVGEKNLYKVVEPVQEYVKKSISRMRSYRQSVRQAVEKIKAKDEADRLAALEAANQEGQTTE